MSIAIANVDVSADTFSNLIGKVNQALGAISNHVITVDNSSSGNSSSGNGYITGIFGANTIFAGTALRGGSVASPATLIITSNVTMQANLLVVGTISHINSVSLANTLVVTGNTNLSNTLIVTGNTRLSNTLVVTGNTNLSNTLIVTGNTRLSNTLTVTGNTTLSNTLTVTGNTRLSNTLVVTGNTTLANTLIVTGNTTLSNTLDVTGNTNLSNTLTVTGNTTLANTLVVTGNTTLSNTLTVTGNTTLSNTLVVTGNTTLANTLIVTGNTTLSNTLVVTGNTTLDNTLTVTGPTTMQVSDENPALKITQSGTGHALYVEDTTSPDPNPTVITNDGVFIAGSNSQITINGAVARIQSISTEVGTGTNYLAAGYANLSNQGARITFYKSRSENTALYSAVTNGDQIARLDFFADDGGQPIEASRIMVLNNGTPGPNSMPTSMYFYVTGEGSNSALSGGPKLAIFANGNVSVGGSITPTAKFVVTGTANVSGNAAFGSQLSVGGQLSVTGNTTLANTLVVTGNTNLSNTFSVIGNTTLANTLTVTGNTALANTLTVTGNTTLANTLVVTGNTRFSNTLTVTGNTTLANTLTVTGNTDIIGNTNLGSTLIVTGNTTLSRLTVSGNTTINGNTNLSNTLIVTGNTTLSKLNVTGNTDIIGNTNLGSTLNVTGDIRASANVYGTLATVSQPYITSNNTNYLNGQPSSYYTNATNIITGTINTARISGDYNNITSVGILTNLFVTGNASLANTLTVIGNTNLANTLTVTGNVNFSNTVTVTGNATFSNTVTINNLIVTGNTNIDTGTLYIDNVNDRIGIGNTSPDAKLTVTGAANVSGNVAIGGGLTVTGNTIFDDKVTFLTDINVSNAIFQGPANIQSNDTNPTLKITQSGSGHALYVEDQISPDSTPTVITSTGYLVSGANAAVTVKTAYRIQSLVDSGGSYLAATTANIHNQGARYGFYKTRSGNIETYSAVANGDQIGRLDFYADDGGQPIEAARIMVLNNGTPGPNSMPSAIHFYTTGESSNNALTSGPKLSIVANGNVGVGSGTPTEKLYINGNLITIGNAVFSDQVTITGNTTIDNGTFVLDTVLNTVGIGAPTPNTKFSVAGPIALSVPVKVSSTSYTVTATDASIIFDTTANCNVVMPAAATYPGRILYVKTIAARTINSTSASIKPIDSNTAANNILTNVAGKFAMLQSDGSNWVIMMNN